MKILCRLGIHRSEQVILLPERGRGRIVVECTRCGRKP